MKAVKVCEYRKEKSEISCTVMVRIKMDDAIQLILKMELEEGVCAKIGFGDLLFLVVH